METETSTVLGTAEDRMSEPVQDKFETIRGLLVGNEFDSLNERLVDLRRVHEESFEKIQKNTMAELATMQAEGKAEISNVSSMVVEMIGQLQNEDSAQAEGMRSLGNDLEALEKQVQNTAMALTCQMEELRSELTSKMADITQILEAQQKEVSQNSVSRSDFASILNGLAGSIAPEPATAGEAK